MRVVCTAVAVLSLAVVASRANENSTERCCPSLFTVNPKPQEFHFRCEVANLTDGCDNVTMTEDVPNTAINTFGESGACGISYLMTDPNWMDVEDFRENIACAYFLPAVNGCRWELELIKPLDPIVNGNNCQCDCEDNVIFEEVDGQSGIPNTRTFCDFTPFGTSGTGFCGDPRGPQNLEGSLPFVTDVNTGVLTTFRSDNINGVGIGALVFATAVQVAPQTSISLARPTSTWDLSLRQKVYCRKLYILCKYWFRSCKMPCECLRDRQQRISCTLYAIFTDATGTIARKHCRSPKDVIRRAAKLALLNIKRFGRPIPTFSQLK